ncbi:ABC transporter substrate-binding protein [Amycolatopsis sp.]|uniref:ABC transporter substrate-binding protein n=1 Tax=Amycolatopsis sp. TaxID=37632 RepID=UPI002D7E7494|nr:ABC transporter substrate-binding protein [Amycolatopsis sp.]HET6706313.1 ABC transporter substrate-binding protein [Amycolatopsis sp.]
MHVRSRKARWTVTAVAVAALLPISSCGTSGSSSSGAATLTLGVQAPPNSLDPVQLLEGQQMYLWSAIYDTLLYSDNDAVLRPNAAESWQYSDDARTLTLNLRPGMKFSTGAPVTAAAVKTTLDRTKATPGPLQSNLDAVRSVEAPDDRKVVLRLSHPDPNLLGSLAQGNGVIGDPATLTAPNTALDPVGSGPYVLDRQATVNGSKYVLHRRDDYWNAAAYPAKTVTVRVIPDRTALFNALLSGEVDAGSVDVSQAQAAQKAGLTLKRVDGVAVGEFVLADRGGKLAPALADVRVRRAINMAFDRRKIVDKILGGLGQPTTQIFNPKSPAYVPALNDRYPYDPAGARRLLAEAGHADGFTLTIPATVVSQLIQPTITQSLADIGITANWKPVPPQDSTQTGEYPVYFNIAGAVPAPRTVNSKLAPTGSTNPFKSQAPELTALMDKAAATTDAKQADEIYRQINTSVVDNAWFAPLFTTSTEWVTRPKVTYRGTGANPLSTLRTFDVGK